MTAITRHHRKRFADEALTHEALTCTEQSSESDSVIIGEAQLILAEKRTSMAAMRTGIAVFALPFRCWDC